MQNKNAVSMKLLRTAILGAFALAPIVGASVAQADPPNQDQKKHDQGQNHHNQGHPQPSNQGHGQNHAPNQGHPQNQPKPPGQGQGQNHGANPNQGHRQNHAPNQGQPQNQPQPFNQGHGQNHAPNQGHPQNQPKPPNQGNRPNHGQHQGHGSSQQHNWQRRNNNYQNDSWHTSHGYVRSGSSWLWHGHDDAWWLSNGYGWNGTIWILNNAVNSYGPFQTFTGTVTNVRNNQEFDIRISGSIYNVYVAGYLPGNLNNGDLVRVYGQRYGNNDIRNSSIRILRNY